MVEDVKCSDGQYKLRIDFGYEADECRFNMRDTDGSGDIEVNSVAFSLSANGPAETTFGLKEPTSSFAETTTEPTSTAPPATTTTTTTDIEPTETKSSGDDGLSTGAKAGIGVGVGLGVVGIAALAGALWLVRRKKGGGGDDASPVERQELYGESAEAKPTYFVQTNQAPKPDEAPPSELMDSRHTRHELTG